MRERDGIIKMIKHRNIKIFYFALLNYIRIVSIVRTII